MEILFKLQDGVTLIELYKTERYNLVKSSRLTEVSVFPKPIERQEVSTCLKKNLRGDFGSIENKQRNKRCSGLQ